MKILLAMDAFPPIIDGAITALMTLARGFQARGHEVSFAIPHQPQTVSQNGHRIFCARSVPFPAYKPYRLTLPWVPNVRKKMKDYDFDLFHIHSPFGMGLIAQQIAAERKIPCVYTFHTLFPSVLENYIQPWDKFLRRPLIRLIRSFCDGVDQIVTQTEPVKNLLREYGVKNRIEVIPLGIDPATVIPRSKIDLRSRHGISKDTPIVLFVGRLAVEKNLPWLIDGLQEASRRNLPFHCFVVGDGNERLAVRRRIDQNRLGGKITLTGLVSQEELAQYYANSDLFCIPSLVESQCLAAIEAMMNGVPVLGVRAMGLTQTIEPGVSGVLTEPDPSSFQEALLRLLSDHRERESLRHGALSLSKRMTAAHSVEKHLQLYRELMDRRAGFKKPLRAIPLIARSLMGL